MVEFVTAFDLLLHIIATKINNRLIYHWVSSVLFLETIKYTAKLNFVVMLDALNIKL